MSQAWGDDGSRRHLGQIVDTCEGQAEALGLSMQKADTPGYMQEVRH